MLRTTTAWRLIEKKQEETTSRKEKNGDGRGGVGDTFTAVFAVVKWWTYAAVIIVFFVIYHTSCIACAWIAEARSLFQQNKTIILIFFVKQQIDSKLSYVCFKKRSQMTSKVLSIKNRHTRRNGAWTGDWFLVIDKYRKNPNIVIGADACASFLQ